MSTNEERRQGTTATDIAGTRVMRSAAFFGVMLAYSLNLMLQHSLHITGQRFYGWALFALVLALILMSVTGVDVTTNVRTLFLTLMSGLLVALEYWNFHDGLYLNASLLAYPILTCWIEVVMAFLVVRRRRRQRRLGTEPILS